MSSQAAFGDTLAAEELKTSVAYNEALPRDLVTLALSLALGTL